MHAHTTVASLGILVLFGLGFLLLVAGPSAAVRRRVTMPSWVRLGPRPPSLLRSVAAHIGLAFAYAAAGGLVGRLADGTRPVATALALVTAAIVAGVGELLRRRRDPLTDTLADFSYAIAVCFVVTAATVAVGVHGGAAPVLGPVVALVLFTVLYLPRRSGWPLLGVTGSAVSVVMTALAVGRVDLPSQVYGGYLAALGLLLAAGVRAGVMKPVSLGRVLSFVLLAAGVGTATVGGGGVVPLLLPVLFVVACFGIARIGEPRLLPPLLIAGLLFVTGPLTDAVGARGVAMAVLVVAALTVATACYLERVTAADAPVRVGGTVAFGSLFAILAGPFVLDGGPVLTSVAGLAGMVLFVGAVASVRRFGPTVIGALEIALVGADRLGVGPGAGLTSTLVVLGGGAALVVLAIRGRGPRVPARLGGAPRTNLAVGPVALAPAPAFAHVIAVAAEQDLPVVRADGRTGNLLLGALEVWVTTAPTGSVVTIGGVAADRDRAAALLAALTTRVGSLG